MLNLILQYVWEIQLWVEVGAQILGAGDGSTLCTEGGT